MAFYFCGLFPKTYNPSLDKIKKKTNLTHVEGHSTKYLTQALKTAKVIKSRKV